MITYVSILAILLSSRNEVWAVLILGELDEPTLIADIVSGSRFDGQNTTRTATSFDIGNETMNSTSTRDNSTRDGSKLGLPLEGHPGITDSARKEVEDKISEIFNDTIANASHIPVANVNQSEAVDPSAAKDIATRTEVTVENSVRSAMKEKSKEIDEQIHHIDEEIKRINETEGILDGTISSVENSARKREEVSEKKKQLERGKKHAEKKKKRLEAEVERELKDIESDISQEEKKEDAHFKPKSGKQRKKHDGKTTTEEPAGSGDHDDELNFSAGVFSKATGGSNSTGDYSNASGEDKVAREIGKRIANAINRTMKKAKRDHRNVTVEELHHVAIDELDRMWHVLENAKRHKHSEAGDFGFETFVESVPFFDWVLLIMATCLSMVVYAFILEWPSSSSMHGFALLIWFAGGAIYNALIFGRQGMNAGIIWMNGYVLELIFMVENVFVFHIIVQAFNLPRMVTQRVLFAVVAIQVLLQMLFYMGLASILRSCQSLPYILGPWLIYCGCQASVEDLDHSYDIMNTRFMIYFQGVMGERLCQGINSSTFFVLKNEKWALSTAGLATVCLLVADFLLEIDVSVTKIESMQDQYLAFSSSVVASFALPELFFIARDFFKRFAGLKFGVGFVLVLFGFQMLMHRYFSFTALENMVIITVAVTCSIFFSVVCKCGERVDRPLSDPPQTPTNSITGSGRFNAVDP
eukprot:TRINITY_DN656_c0_g1_i4.p1 TRINITY_DN656_c0_g1~~TRINITY_DN656_c0_g1_i4.p1  ORF type:complete len:698 (-),score=146.89 TRINITY_DN656_c0_g1_i4:101-2194(-)